MHHPRQTRKPAATPSAATTLAALAVAGCGGPTGNTAAPGTGDAAGGNQDPGQEHAAFTTDRAHHDTSTTRTGPGDSHHRSRRWTHPHLTHSTALAVRHQQRTLWTTHRVVAAVEVAMRAWAGDDPPADTDKHTYRAVPVTATPLGRHSWTGPVTRQTDYCTPTQPSGRWLVTGHQLDEGK